MVKKKIIGYTTGAFDLFHAGHVNILRKCKLHCDYLIVGVSTDELIEQYKNVRPVINLQNRIKVLEAVKYVDRVVIQRNRKKFEAAIKYEFNIMFVGSDWKGSEIFTELEVELGKINVELKFFEYTKGISTSEIVNKLRIQ